MQKLVLNYMRPMAVLLLILVSTAIILSYYFIPQVLAITLIDFYHRYWRVLTVLFVISCLFLIYAFYIDHATWLRRNWMQHVIAVALLVWLIRELWVLINVSDILFAYV